MKIIGKQNNACIDPKIIKKESKLKSWFEEFKLNRQGKTKYQRIDVMGKHRKVDRFLTGLIIVLLLLNLITLVVVFYY